MATNSYSFSENHQHVHTSAPAPAPAPAAQCDLKAEECKQKGEAAEEEKEREEDVTCDWVLCQPAACQPMATPSCLLMWLCLCSYAQGMLLNGFLNSVLTSIERRFELQSVQTGMIASTYDIGACLATLPITYFGRKYRRSRFVSLGAMLVSIGSFVFAMPHFLAGEYKFQSPVAPLCYADGVDYPNLCLVQSQSHYRWLFWLAQLLHGMGAAPFFTLAVAYLDDNLTVKQSGVFMGLYYLTALAGPASGYLLGGLFLNIYVDLGEWPSGLSPQNTNLWVGAWWVGFLISGSLSAAAVLPLFGFPRSFRGSAKARAERRDESHGSSAVRSAKLQATIGDLLPSARLLLSIPTYLCLTLAGTMSSLLVAALATFGPKLMQHFFHLDASAATMSIGLVSVPCGALGLLAGAATLRFVQPRLSRLLKMDFCVALVGLALVSAFLVRCQPQRFAGINSPYPAAAAAAGSSPNFTAACNSDCHCRSTSLMFSPVCDADGVVHFSPCYAGCSANQSFVFRTTRYYSNCGCVSKTYEVNGRNASAADGSCQANSSCSSAPLFLTLLGFFMFCMFFITIPSLQATIRVIPSDLKDFGIGLQLVIMRLLGSVPAPLVLGKLIDSTCSLWASGCDSNGACIAYDLDSLWLLVLLFIAGLKLVEVTLIGCSAAMYRPPPDKASQLPDKAVGVYVVELTNFNNNA